MAEELVINYLFGEKTKQFPDKVCLRIKKAGEWERYTYAEVKRLSLKVASFLLNSGIGKGDFVILILENSPEWAISYLGILYAGSCAVPLDPQLTIKEIENITADCGPKAIFLSERIFKDENFKRLRSRFRKIILIDSLPDFEKEDNVIDFSFLRNYEAPAEVSLPELSPDDNASLIYTSGTTGIPKGILLSHRNFCSNAKSFGKLKICNEEDTFLSVLPLFHSYAFMSGLLAPILTGSAIAYCRSFKPEDIAEVVRESGVTVLPAVPQFFTLLRNKIFLKYDEASAFLKPFVLFLTKIKVRKIFGRTLRLFVSGGARLEPNTGRDIAKLGIDVLEGYGLTETSPIVSLNLPKKVKFGSVGKIIPDVEVKIDKPDQSGIGEIVIRGPNVMKGYYKRPDLTEKVIKRGWFYSGDLGYLDSEGHLFITGRLKEIIVLSSGKKIFPEELEAIYGPSPYIKEICIIGGDDQKGLQAIVVPDLEYFRQKDISNICDRIKWELENISRGLPSHSHIMGFTIAKESLPRTRLGKIKRFELQKGYERIEEGPEKEEEIYSDTDLALLSQDVSKKILDFLEKRFKKEIELEDSLEIDLGIDSLGRVELADRLEVLLKIAIPTEILAKVFSVRELLAKINSLEGKEITGEVEEKTFDWKELLNKMPKEEVLRKVRLSPSLRGRILTFIFTNLILFLFKLFWSLKIEGIERLPKEGPPYILCPNHTSYLDGFVVASSMPYRLRLKTFFLGYAAYFEHPLTAWGIKIFRLIPLDPDTQLVDAMQISSYVLNNEKVMCIFPEGVRSIDENVQSFKKGVGILAKELNIPLVPVYIKGTHFAWPRTRLFPRPYPLKVIFGHPFSATELFNKSKDVERDEYTRIASALREEVLNLARG